MKSKDMAVNQLTGEDKVIITCIAIISVITVVAVVSIVLSPTSKDTIVPMMSVAIAAIATLAARHPPSAPAGTVTTTGDGTAPQPVKGTPDTPVNPNGLPGATND